MLNIKTTTITTLNKPKQSNTKITSLTCYDASFAEILTNEGINVILVGDSLGMVIQGASTTISVMVDDMTYHIKSVVTGINNAIIKNNTLTKPMVISDLPFMTYSNNEAALRNGARLLQAGCQMVKLEGGEAIADTVYQLSSRGIPVCAHIGLMPQFCHQLGGFKVQGRNVISAEKLMQDARSLEQAGAQAIVLECIPQHLATDITTILNIPTIGIGAGKTTDGQVLVIYDVLGITPGYTLKFSHNFLQEAHSIPQAIKNYANAVRNGEFPKAEHYFE